VDEARYMRRSLELASKAEGSFSPRPPVAAVIVSDGEIAGEGFTQAGEGLHAETFALEAAGDRARGATLFVTLEPCAKRCAPAVVAAGVGRVVASMQDPNPECDGRGFAMVRDAGIDVQIGEGEAEARGLIEAFAKWISTGLPFVTLKIAMSLDGKVAAPDGTSQWITSEKARAEVHELRRRVDAVLIGAGTVEIDDPQLTFRTPGLEGTQPLRVVVDSSGRTRPTARIFNGDAPALVLSTDDAGDPWTPSGIDVARLPASEGGVDLKAALEELGGRGLCHVLVEAGPTLAGSFAAARLVDRFIFYVAPKLIGGDAPGAFAAGVKTLTDAWELEIESVRTVGTDIRIDARPR
jgi:diaminohydroxyphosphoribosylaminopyrimidine deaminase/5-amino-6-(5-phosphoribosylamino)uracil reductase